jgi:hypothetical protein
LYFIKTLAQTVWCAAGTKVVHDVFDTIFKTHIHFDILHPISIGVS